MTWADILSEIRQELQEATASEWTDAELLAYTNDGVLLLSQLLEWRQKTAILVPVVGQQDYSLPSDCLHLKSVTFDRKFLPQTTQSELDRDAGNWRGAGNDDPIRFFLKQWDTLSLYPKPEDAGTSVTHSAETGIAVRVEDPSGTSDPDVTFDTEVGIVIAVEDSEGGHVRFDPDTIADPFTAQSAELGMEIDYDTDEDNIGLYYSSLPDAMTATTDTPQLHSICHPALVSYAVFRAFQREGPMQDLKLAQDYFTDFADWTQEVMRLKNRQWPEHGMALEPVSLDGGFIARLNELGSGIESSAALRAHYE